MSRIELRFLSIDSELHALSSGQSLVSATIRRYRVAIENKRSPSLAHILTNGSNRTLHQRFKSRDNSLTSRTHVSGLSAGIDGTGDCCGGIGSIVSRSGGALAPGKLDG
jgi:hypothetical protein